MSGYALPAPVPLLSFLLYLTLAVHLVMMNLTLGGALLCSTYIFKGKEKHLVIAEAMASRLPYFMAFTITFGIAPLLFVQTLYPALFYNAALSFSSPFLLILANVFVSYVLIYACTKKWDALGIVKGFLYLAVVVLLGFVMFVYNNIFSFMEGAADNPSLYTYSRSGFAFNFENPTLLPRFLHFFFSSVAVAGLWVAVWGIFKLKKEPEQGRWQYRSGATYFSAATILVMVTGLWWLMVLPRETMMLVMGKNLPYTILFGVLFLTAIGALVLALLGMNSVKPSAFLRAAAVMTAFNIVSMIILRDGFRTGQLDVFVDLGALKVNFQWGAFTLFVLCLAAAVYGVYDISRRVMKAGAHK